MTTVLETIDLATDYQLQPPEPLRRTPEPPETYPISALGDVLGPAAQVIIDVIRCPDAIAAQSVLAAATLSVQAHADILIDGRRITLNQFFIGIGESGNRKSAADQAALAPVSKRQRHLLETYAKQRVSTDIETAVWKKEHESALRSKTKDERKNRLEQLGPAPVPPLFPMLTTEEPTYEGLVKLLDGGWPSVGLFSDEGGRFLGGHAMSEDQRLKTMSGLSSLWDGRPITRTRAGEGSIILFGRRVSLSLLIQPAVSELLFCDRLAQDQGLLSRCLVSAPTSTLGQQKYVEADLNAKTEYERYFGRMMSILELGLPWEKDANGNKTGGVDTRGLGLDSEAKRLWVIFHDWVQTHLGEEGILRPISGIAAKAAEHSLRLAGVLALTDDVQAESVSKQHIEAGIVLARYYLTEALRLFDSAGINPELLLAEKLLNWIKGRSANNSDNSGNSSGLIYPVLVYQRGPNPLRDRATAMKIIEILEDHGWVIRVEGGAVVDGRHRQDVWTAHPALWGSNE